MKFKYDAISIQPDSIIEVSGICEALDENYAREQLIANGLTIVDIREASSIDLRIERLRKLQQVITKPKVPQVPNKVMVPAPIPQVDRSFRIWFVVIIVVVFLFVLWKLTGWPSAIHTNTQ